MLLRHETQLATTKLPKRDVLFLRNDRRMHHEKLLF